MRVPLDSLMNFTSMSSVRVALLSLEDLIIFDISSGDVGSGEIGKLEVPELSGLQRAK